MRLLIVLLVPACTADPDAAPPDAPAAEPQAAGRCSGYQALRTPFFGDLHTHTAYSYDAYTFSTRKTPLDAYAFARSRGLDFAAITDHSEWLAIDYGCGVDPAGNPYDPDSPYFDEEKCVTARSTQPLQQSINFLRSFANQRSLCGTELPADSPECRPVIQEAWGAEIAAAQTALDRCRFTSFIGYEWTNSCTGDGGTAATCHKNVIFGDSNVPGIPFDSLAFDTQEKLWSALDTGCNGGPCNAITIPHNSNLSDGQAFKIPQGSEDHAIKYQKLVEIFQHKGGSECFFDSTNPTDPACDFNYMPNDSDTAANYVRTGLETGLAAQASALHKNPLQMGIIGATDDHNGQAGDTREDTWNGHVNRLDNTPELRLANNQAAGMNPGGVAVAWAEENTREAIFAAFKRRETYATSGPRITVRMYQTWDQTTDFCRDPNFPAKIEAAGLPMGSNITLPAGYTTGAPRIVVYVARDPASRPDAANLASIDLVEAWIGPAGVAKERVVRSSAPVGGLATMCRTFSPVVFKRGTPSFYYARVLQVPTKRWSAYDCAAAPDANRQGCAPGGGLDVEISERAWTSPIWYLP
ncbi:MAG: DUF3604 domain-containing protein [Kofleriaceae bacterium]